MELQTSSLNAGKDIEFQNVYYNVTERKNYIKVTGTRQILRGVSGCFRNGELSAIMGPSGAGKSSLLNAISGYRASGVSGHLQINRTDSCYITQEDHHQTLLNVEELMHLACDLKLKNCKNKVEVITEVLENLNINHIRQTTADKLSGGERKRLSIALELVANPKIFFLDEPTSGLDEVTAAQCIRLLSQLAKQGRTIVCTIHQPSAAVFNYFDRIYVMARGKCVYQGKPGAVIPFLRHVNLDCPMYYSPSDYIIELCDAEEGKLIPMLSDHIENGKLIYIPHEKTIEDANDMTQDVKDNLAQEPVKVFHQALTTLFLEQSRCNYFTNSLGYSVRTTDGSIFGGATAIYEHMKAFSKRMASSHSDVSEFRQFYVLLRVMTLRIMRARIALVIQLMHHLSCGIFFGLIFYNLGNQGSRMFDHLKFCFGSVLMIVYTQVMVPILSYPSEVKIVKKQTFNRWYTLTPYYMALTISRIPLQMLFNLIFLSLTYWMADLPAEWWRFGLYVCVGQMTSLASEGLGLAIGATFSITIVLNFTFLSIIYWMSDLPAEWLRFGLFLLIGQLTSLIAEGMGLAIGASVNTTNGCVLGPLIMAPLMGVAGYGFDFATQISSFMNIIMNLSYIRVSVVSLVLSLFGFSRTKMDCEEIYCHFDDPRVLLKFLDIDQISMISQLALMTIALIFFRTILFISLKLRCNK